MYWVNGSNVSSVFKAQNRCVRAICRLTRTAINFHGTCVSTNKKRVMNYVISEIPDKIKNFKIKKCDYFSTIIKASENTIPGKVTFQFENNFQLNTRNEKSLTKFYRFAERSQIINLCCTPIASNKKKQLVYVKVSTWCHVRSYIKILESWRPRFLPNSIF